MRKKIRKLTKVLACIMMLSFISLNVNAETLSTSEKVNYVQQALIQKGVSESVVEKMSTTVKLDMYEKMQQYDFYVSDIEEKVVTFQASTDEYSATPYGTISESTMSMISMYTNYVTDTKIELVECYYYSEWLSDPFVNCTDALTINWDSSLLTLYDFAAYPSGLFGGVLTTNLDPITRAAEAAQGGYGIEIPLHEELENQCLEMITIFCPRDPLYTTSEISSNINYEYAHDTLAIAAGIGFTVSGVSVNIDPAVGVNTAAEIMTYYTNKEIVSEDW